MRKLTKNNAQSESRPLIDLTDKSITIKPKNEYIYEGIDFGLNKWYTTREEITEEQAMQYLNNPTEIIGETFFVHTHDGIYEQYYYDEDGINNLHIIEADSEFINQNKELTIGELFNKYSIILKDSGSYKLDGNKCYVCDALGNTGYKIKDYIDEKDEYLSLIEAREFMIKQDSYDAFENKLGYLKTQLESILTLSLPEELRFVWEKLFSEGVYDNFDLAKRIVNIIDVSSAIYTVNVYPNVSKFQINILPSNK